MSLISLHPSAIVMRLGVYIALPAGSSTGSLLVPVRWLGSPSLARVRVLPANMAPRSGPVVPSVSAAFMCWCVLALEIVSLRPSYSASLTGSGLANGVGPWLTGAARQRRRREGAEACVMGTLREGWQWPWWSWPVHCFLWYWACAFWGRLIMMPTAAVAHSFQRAAIVWGWLLAVMVCGTFTLVRGCKRAAPYQSAGAATGDGPVSIRQICSGLWGQQRGSHQLVWAWCCAVCLRHMSWIRDTPEPRASLPKG